MTRRVLLIDDNADVREIARLSLELTADVEVDTAGSGREGLRKATASPPDAILLDVHMPELDGPATLRFLRDDPRTEGVPVVFITARVQASEREGYEALGVSGVLEKPFDPVRIGPALAAILGW